MTTRNRQPYSAYPRSLLDEVRAQLKAAEISVAQIAKLHGIPRTTVLGWQKKVDAKMELRCKGGLRKLGPFEETNLLGELLRKVQFQSPDSISKYLENIYDTNISARTVQRLLLRWGIGLNARWPQDLGKGGRPLLLWRREWRQPEDTVYESKPPHEGILWLLITRKGVKGFTFADDSDKAILRVITALEPKLTPRHRLVTNCQRFAEAAKSHASWRVALIDRQRARELDSQAPTVSAQSPP